jgi:hypothetical protein
MTRGRDPTSAESSSARLTDFATQIQVALFSSVALVARKGRGSLPLIHNLLEGERLHTLITFLFAQVPMVAMPTRKRKEMRRTWDGGEAKRR